MKISWKIAGLTVASLILAVLLLLYSKELAEDFEPGVLRTTYQFLLLVVVGGVISWLWREFDRRREERAEARQELNRLHADLVDSYNDYKRIKRLLRARALRIDPDDSKNTPVLLVSEYVPLLCDLNEVQLRFEAHKRLPLSTNPLVKDEDAGKIKEALASIEKYLNKVVQEFEASLRKIGKGTIIPLDDLKNTSEFVGSGGDARRDAAISSFENTIDQLTQMITQHG